MSLSTATPERFPDIETLRRLTKSLAMLDAIICPEWEYRYLAASYRSGVERCFVARQAGVVRERRFGAVARNAGR